MKNRKITILAAVILFAALIVVIALRLLSPEDTWLCQKGKWVRHGNPSGEPTGVCK